MQYQFGSGHAMPEELVLCYSHRFIFQIIA